MGKKKVAQKGTEILEEIEKPAGADTTKAKADAKAGKAGGDAEKKTSKSDKANDDSPEGSEGTEDAEEKMLPPQVRRTRVTGKKYKKAAKKVKEDTTYSLKEALKLLKDMSYADFDETVELHLKVNDSSVKGEVTLPHGTGKTINVVVADDSVIKKIEKGDIDFDILVSSPSFMSKIVPHAKVLGPRGLMPNPKRGTVTENPKETAEKLRKGTVLYKTEPKNNLIHQPVGKLSFAQKNLIENIETFMDAVDRKKITTAYVAATMTPSVEIEV